MSYSTSPGLNTHGSGQPLDLDPIACAMALGRSPMPLRHNLSGHPLLTLEKIAALADRLPATSSECVSGQREFISPGSEPRRLPKPSEAVIGIESSGAWMAVRNIEKDANYRELLDEALDQVSQLLPVREGGMRLREAFIFLSAPGAVTPAHIDPEHNILLQVRGTKEFNTGEFTDRAIEGREIQRYLSGGHRNLAEMPASAGCFPLSPGDGLYIPPWRPHWVRNGHGFSISLSLAFRTGLSQRCEYAQMVNLKMQRLGLSPRPVGESVWLDNVKASYVRGKRLLRRAYGLPQDTRNY